MEYLIVDRLSLKVATCILQTKPTLWPLQPTRIYSLQLKSAATSFRLQLKYAVSNLQPTYRQPNTIIA